MPRGRFISSSISKSRKFAAVHTDTARMLYLLLIPHADREGRLEADPIILRGAITPRLPLTETDIQASLEDLHLVDLIRLYLVDGEQFLQIVGFEEHNTPHKREADSKIPPPESGQGHDLVTPKANPRSDEGQPKAGLRTNGVRDTNNAISPTLGRTKSSLRPPEVEVEVKEEVEEEVKELPPLPPLHQQLATTLLTGETDRVKTARLAAITQHIQSRGEKHTLTALQIVEAKLSNSGLDNPWTYYQALIRRELLDPPGQLAVFEAPAMPDSLRESFDELRKLTSDLN